MTQENQPQPGAGEYILAWFVAVALSAAAGALMGPIQSMISEIERPLILFSVSMGMLVLASILQAVIWIIVYSGFASLRLSAVIPWIWGLGTLGVFVTAWRASILAHLTGQSAGPIVFTFISQLVVLGIGFLLWVQIFRIYFKRTGRISASEKNKVSGWLILILAVAGGWFFFTWVSTWSILSSERSTSRDQMVAEVFRALQREPVVERMYSLIQEHDPEVMETMIDTLYDNYQSGMSTRELGVTMANISAEYFAEKRRRLPDETLIHLVRLEIDTLYALEAYGRGDGCAYIVGFIPDDPASVARELLAIPEIEQYLDSHLTTIFTADLTLPSYFDQQPFNSVLLELQVKVVIENADRMVEAEFDEAIILSAYDLAGPLADKDPQICSVYARFWEHVLDWGEPLNAAAIRSAWQGH